MTRATRIAALHEAARERILVLDGSWGVMIQRQELAEADFRGDRFGRTRGTFVAAAQTAAEVVDHDLRTFLRGDQRTITANAVAAAGDQNNFP